MKRRPLTIAAAFLIAIALPAEAADTVTSVDAAFKTSKGTVEASFRLPGVLDEELRQRAISGLTNNILVTAQLDAADGSWKGPPSLVTIQAIYDVWGEEYIIRRTDLNGVTKISTREQAPYMETFSRLESVPVAAESALDQSKKYVLRVTVSVNPLSKEVLEKAKEYLADPDSAKRLSSSRNVFGSFARTFVPSAISESGKVYRFQSQAIAAGAIRKGDQ
jgi:hypothetical protein